MSRIPPPPSIIQCNYLTLRRGLKLCRMHRSRFQPTQFNPGFGVSRFAPFEDVAGKKVPTAYLASSFACAAFEFVFHDVKPSAIFKTISLLSITDVRYSEITINRDLKLARLFEADLNKMGITRAQLIDTPRTTYKETAFWAAAIHAADNTVDGLIWTSKRCDPERAIVLFGDRVSATDLSTQSSAPIMTDKSYLKKLRDLGASAGITLTV